MSRAWVKLHVDMLAHPGTGRLSDSAFRAWITMLLMAGRTDNGGGLGDVADVAWQLRWTEEQVNTALKELNGRVARDGATLTVRDWHEWQAERDTSAAARMARYRDKKRNGDGVVDEAQRNVTSPELRSRIEEESEEEQEQTTAAPNGAASAASGERWAPFYNDCGELWHTSPYRKDGAALSWAGQLAHHFGRFADDDVTQARRLLRQWSRSPDFKFALSPTAAPPKAGKWLTENAAVDAAVQR